MLKKNTSKTSNSIMKKATPKKGLSNPTDKKKLTTNSLYLELLQDQTRERALGDNYPSKILSKPWICSINETNNYPPSTERSGKWCVFINKEEHDEWWIKVKQALIEGKLGSQIKTCTGWKSPLAVSEDKAVIIVFTYDYENKDDAMRIRNELRLLGVTWKVAYKPDRVTREGKYSNRGDKKISVYYE